MITILLSPNFVSLSVLVITYSIMRIFLMFVILVLCIEKSFQVDINSIKNTKSQ